MSYSFRDPSLHVIVQQFSWQSGTQQHNQLRAGIEDAVVRVLTDTPEMLLSYADVETAFQILTTKPDGSRDPEGWRKLCWHNQKLRNMRGGLYEFWNQEFIMGLAHYVIDRARELQLSAPVKILEVWAGNGALTFFLQRALVNIAGSDMFQVVATDNSSYKIPAIFDVRTCSHVDALEAYQPDMVLVSWMDTETLGNEEYTLDIGFHIEETPSVREYVLIGTTETCGITGLTWNHHIRPCEDLAFIELLGTDNVCNLSTVVRYAPEYRGKFGRFSMQEVRELLPYQIGAQHDVALHSTGKYENPEGYHSRTVSFRRIGG